MLQRGGGERRPARRASQPSRSSRCGQSVGTERKLPRWPQTMLRQSWLTSSLGALERARLRRVGVHDAAGDRVSVEARRAAGDLDVAEAVEGEARLEDLARRRPRACRCRAGARCAGWRGRACRRARASRRSAAARASPRSPLHAQPRPADHVLAEVDDVHAGRALGAPRPGASSSVTRIGWARSGTSRTSSRDVGTRLQPASSSRLGPAGRARGARRSARPSAGRRTRSGRCVARQLPSVATISRVPSAYSRCSSHSSSGARRSGCPAGARRSRRSPAYQPSPRIAPSALSPSRSSAVTS